MKKIFLSSLLLCFSLALFGQASTATWKFEQKKADDGTIEVIATASIAANWHLYSSQPVEGPMPTAFEFKESAQYELIGGITESIKPKEKHDEAFGIKVKIFENTAVFVQKIKALTDKPFTLSGTVSYQTCSGDECLFDETEFSLQIEPGTNAAANTDNNEAVSGNAEETDNATIVSAKSDETKSDDTGKKESMLGFILAAIAAGLACILTPCVFPMIPMTVSFFMSGSKNRGQTVGKAIVFWLSVGIVYGMVGVIIAIFKSEAVATFISSHWFPNLLFALLFIIFAASFFGMFEITLPSKWSNSADQQVDKGGFLASFFLAVALACVSFSCTGPFLGSLISDAISGTSRLKPILGFTCFGLALGSPYLIFAIFPSLMNLLKSGSWLNSVKVVFAFIMLGFSLKFLVQVENYLNWNIISREVAIGFWITLAVLMGIYILGKIKFSHDSDVPHIGFVRLLFATAAFTFAVYLVPGLFGADLEAVSAFLPGKEKQSFDLTKMQVSAGTTPGGTHGATTATLCNQTPKYAGLESRMSLPDNIPGYFDLKEAKECARSLNKPVFLDFTGIFCSNCKKMKVGAFKDPRVVELLNKEFVFVALYVDVKTIELPAEEQITNSNGKTLKTLGELNADYQLQKFAVRSQPYFAIIDADENIMAKDLGYANADDLLKFLNEGLAAFKNKK